MCFRRALCAISTGVSFLAAAPLAAATIDVPAGGNLQAALNAAHAGDVITLAPGATYVGNFVLPNKGPLADYITIRSAAPDALLPRAGVRMTPAFAAQLPKIKSGNNMSALQTAASANHYKLMFLEFQANKDGYGDIIGLGAGDSTQTQLSQVPYALVLDRVFVHGDPVFGQKRGIALHSADTTVINSWVSDFKAVLQEAQAIQGFNGPGNYLIENNYLEGATQNFFLGGSDPKIPNLVTTNVTFRRNYLTKPLAWRDAIAPTPTGVGAVAAPGAGTLAAGTYYYKVVARVPSGQTGSANSNPSVEVSATIPAGTSAGIAISWTPVAGASDYVVYGRTAGSENINWTTTVPYFTDAGAAGTSGSPPTKATKWMVKNVFELKNAQDVVIEGNIFENLWVADQPGFPIVFTPRNQNGTAPWVVVQRVTFQRNIVRHTAGGVNILGTDNNAPSQRTNHITIRDNVFDDLTAASWGSGARPFQIGNGGDAITIDHNTVITTDSTILWLYGGSATNPTPITNVVFTNNMSAHNTYGIFGSSFSTGLSSINAYLPGSIITANVLAGGNASKYPTGNFFPTVAVWQSNFVNYAAGDYHLAGTSIYKGVGTDLKDLGADIEAVNAQTAGALTGDNSATPNTPRVRIMTTTLPNGTFGLPYAQLVSCVGGTPGCAWQVQDARLPAGVSFDATAGVVFGTPTAVETGTLSLIAYDQTYVTNTASATLTLTIDPPPFSVAIPAAPDGTVGAAYQLTATVSGAMGSPTWSVSSGSLPGGLALDALSGTIAGVPTAWGTTTAVIQAQDSWGTARTDAKPVTITIAPAPLAIASSTLGAAQYQTPYNAMLTATGGTGSQTWALVAGALPAGFALDAAGAINGTSQTPAAIGTFTFTVRATDSNWAGNSATKTLALTVVPPPIGVTAMGASAGTVGVPYAAAAPVVTGLVGAPVWSIASGALPAGLALNATSGIISGVPAVYGVFTAAVQAQDSWDPSRTASAPMTITIAPAPLAISTAALADGTVGRAYQSTLTSAGGTGLTTWTITAGALPGGLAMSSNGIISGTPLAPGSFAITVQATDAGWAGLVATKALNVKVVGREVVLYASDATTIAGTWSLVNDAAAAGGARIWNQDKGAAKVQTPLANPANYFEIPFQAESGVAYHLWVRGKADANSWANDSVIVQFSGSVDAAGNSIYRIGTTTGADVNLEDCSGCGESGWGWQDNGWGVNLMGPHVYFAQTGPQTIRVQVKEDGFSIDQIVLSADRYKTAAPGALKNDTTIVPR
jgi:hypothetical protein